MSEPRTPTEATLPLSKNEIGHTAGRRRLGCLIWALAVVLLSIAGYFLWSHLGGAARRSAALKSAGKEAKGPMATPVVAAKAPPVAPPA